MIWCTIIVSNYLFIMYYNSTCLLLKPSSSCLISFTYHLYLISPPFTLNFMFSIIWSQLDISFFSIVLIVLRVSLLSWWPWFLVTPSHTISPRPLTIFSRSSPIRHTSYDPNLWGSIIVYLTILQTRFIYSDPLNLCVL